jgi:hypothetical protein
MGKWLAGFAATVIACVPAWWLTESIQRPPYSGRPHESNTVVPPRGASFMASAQSLPLVCKVSGGARINRAAVTIGTPIVTLTRNQISWDGSRWKERDARGRRIQILYAFDYDRVAELRISRALGVDYIGETTRAQVSSILKQAFDTWAAPLGASEFPLFAEVDWRPRKRHGPGIRVTTITFKPFIRVSWAAGRHEHLLSHQLAKNFDAGELAHTLLPQGEMTTEDPDKNLGGVCFNTAIPWSFDGSPLTYDIVSNAIHEIGHALGLGHSDNPASVMYHEFDGRPKRQLADEDKAMIRMLYP